MKTAPDNILDSKPKNLICSDINWRYMYRSVVKAKNILILGNSGCGKTLLAHSIAKALNRKFFLFNCGAMSDPRSSLIGNTQFVKDKGTLFCESHFIKGIRTENSVVLLDEISRCHPDGWNILMSALDPLQRYVRLDEKSDNETVNVADGVCFVATANVGNEYTATRVMDRALLDRFSVIIEMGSLSKNEEYQLLMDKYPNVDKTLLEALTQVTSWTRDLSSKDGERITNYISTRSAVEMAELFSEGFSFEEVAEVAIYPIFSNDGGVDSERTFVKQYTQKFIPVKAATILGGNIPNVPTTPQGRTPW